MQQRTGISKTTDDLDEEGYKEPIRVCSSLFCDLLKKDWPLFPSPSFNL